MRRLLQIGLVLAGILLAAAIWVRVAPVDPARWNVDLGAAGYRPPPNAAVFCPRPDTRFAPDLRDPASVLAALDAIAVSTPRTKRLAGSPEAGRITWITRSLLFGYPDFTTAAILTEAQGGPRLCVIARQRFGSYDWGVNAARLGRWMQALLGLAAPPDLGSF